MGKSMVTIVLRGLASLAFLTASVLIFKTNQIVERDYVIFIVRYQDWSDFVFCGAVAGIACFYNFVVLFIHPASLLWKTVIATDVIINILVGASLGAGWQTYMLIIQGNIHASWQPICDVAAFFCRKVLGSLIVSTFGFVLSIGLQMGILQVSNNPCLVDEYLNK